MNKLMNKQTNGLEKETPPASHYSVGRLLGGGESR